MLLGLAFAAAAVLALKRLQPTTSIAECWWALALLGAGTGLALPSMTITALASVPAAEAGPPPAHFVQADVSTREGVAALVQESTRILGGIDVLINNVGNPTHPPGPAWEMADEHWLGDL